MPPVPEDPDRAPPEVLRLADDYLAAGRPFAAHEVLETAWKHRPEAERDLWQGLAQVAVGLTHVQRDNSIGAIALLRRGVEHLSRATHVVAECDPVRVAREASAIADLLESQNPNARGRATELRLLS